MCSKDPHTCVLACSFEAKNCEELGLKVIVLTAHLQNSYALTGAMTAIVGGL